jgi:hypothetical protein
MTESGILFPVLIKTPNKMTTSKKINPVDKNGHELTVGCCVTIPDPIDIDIHSHSFSGTIADFVNGLAIVEDGESDFFSIEPSRLEIEKQINL